MENIPKPEKPEEPKKVNPDVPHEIVINPNGTITGWCPTLRELGLIECNEDCSKCWCG